MADRSIIEINQSALAKTSPKEAETIAGYMPQVDGRLYPTVPVKDSYLNVTFPVQGTTGAALFNSAEPKNEIAFWVSKHKLDENAFHAAILVGFELGYLAKEIIKRLPEHGVLAIVEPDPIVFFTAFCHTDLSVLLGDKRVHLIIGQPVEKSVESIGRELKWMRFLTLPYAFVVSPYMEKRNLEFVKNLGKHWRDCLQREIMYRNSRIEHSSQVVANTVANSYAITQYPGVSSLFYHFRNLPAMLVSAGPSLDDNLDTIKLLQERFLICCVNTAYPVLRRKGIEPHIVITMDHQERNIMSFQEFAPTPKTYLIADPRIQPEIIRRFHPRVFLASWKTTTEVTGEPQPIGQIPVPEKSGNAFYEWLQQQIGAKGDVFGSGSVAVAAFHILCRLGVKEVILAGQDLAYSDQKAYASGTINDPKAQAQSAQTVESTEGNMVGTSEPLYLYKHLLEHEIARFQIPVLNTSSGAVIRGTITTRLSSLDSELPKQIPNIPEILRSLHQSYRPNWDHIDLQRRLEGAVTRLRALSEDARYTINDLPEDWRDRMRASETKEWVKRLEEKIQTLQSQHSEAFWMMNELLQESHFKFEEGTWQVLTMKQEAEKLLLRLENHVMVFDEFVKQSNVLISLLEDQIEVLDKM